jgi:hypothetical protein
MLLARNPTMAKPRRKPDDTDIAELSPPELPGDAAPATMDRDRVAQRAYELYLARGCGEGQDLDDWLCAEREISRDRTVEGSSSRDEE